VRKKEVEKEWREIKELKNIHINKETQNTQKKISIKKCMK
jgi:hypothetical protein